ncbi:hypothetical protein Scep_015092 [Stephania cephalantha]|uniref:Uncharacterized protein n=1 Tax=Stephania cephalantha TaxID=152367 RepID=A0AAP0J2F1_9MAGN
MAFTIKSVTYLAWNSKHVKLLAFRGYLFMNQSLDVLPKLTFSLFTNLSFRTSSGIISPTTSRSSLISNSFISSWC